jgi:cell division protein FtsN
MARARSRRGTQRRRKSSGGWGCLWLLAGSAVGLGIAVVVWLGNPQVPRGAPEPAVRQSAPQPAPAPATAPAPAPAPAPDPGSSERERFQFYDLLPRQEVVVPGRDQPARRDDTPVAPAASQYVLQAGSFSRYPDADRVKAQLALIGINATVQPVIVDGIEYHRVRIGPISDPEELDRLRSRLRQEKIEAVVMRVTD